jgi:hypothetical protein
MKPGSREADLVDDAFGPPESMHQSEQNCDQLGQSKTQ